MELIELLAAIQSVSSLPHYIYPWTDLLGSHDQSLRLFGYGSLMNRQSASRTLTDSTPRRPAIAYGVRRVFDYVMPERVRQRYPGPKGSKEYGVLNVYRTNNPEDSINGMLIEIGCQDVSALREREVGYDLVPVVCSSHEEANDWLDTAYILACPSGSPNTDSTLLPHPGYLDVCLTGARDVSEQFAREFVHTTYIADQTTRLSDWMRDGSRT